MSDQHKATRIALLALESLILCNASGQKSPLTFEELAAQYGRGVGVTAEMARAAIEVPLSAVLEDLQDAQAEREGMHPALAARIMYDALQQIEGTRATFHGEKRLVEIASRALKQIRRPGAPARSEGGL